MVFEFCRWASGIESAGNKCVESLMGRGAVLLDVALAVVQLVCANQRLVLGVLFSSRSRSHACNFLSLFLLACLRGHPQLVVGAGVLLLVEAYLAIVFGCKANSESGRPR
mgnify:CR=1 FL=1